MARHIDRKLRLTAAVLGTVTRKDLATAFRRVNPVTTFDVDRAHKWLQGRAQPRELSVYEDWAKLLDLGRPGAWIADCDVETFVEAVCARHGLDRQELERQAEALSRPPSSRQEERGLALALGGTYVCYSHAWSPYYRGQLIRGALSIDAGSSAERPSATYAENLPTGRLQLSGSITLAKRGMYLDLREAGGDAQCLFCLFPPSPPGSVLGGYMSGAAMIGPEPQPSVTRVVMIRLHNSSSRHQETGGYLPPGASIADDLATFGLKLEHPQTLEHHLNQFLSGGGSGGLDQIPAGEFRTLVEILDRDWLSRQT